MRLKYLKIIVQTQISTIQDHSELLYLSQNSLFLSLTSFQNINVCTETPCIQTDADFSAHLIENYGGFLICLILHAIDYVENVKF